MNQQWGREESAGDWPSDRSVWTIAAFFVALASVGAICAYRYERVWTPLQKHYLSAYLATDAGALRKNGRYTLLMAQTRKGTELALDEEVVPVTTATGENTFALTDAAVKAGVTKLEWQRGQYDNPKLHALLAHWIYNDQSPTDLARPALWSGLGVFVVGLIVAIPKDAARARERKHGRRLKGPELVTASVFNRRTRADGIGFVQQQRFGEKLIGKRRWLRIPSEIEASHLLIMGDSGTGKSALIRQILLAVEARGETAIVYDPALEYVLRAKLGKTGSCHLFRHTMATLMLEGGADIRYIQQMLGHAELSTTEIYTHVSIRMLKQVHSATHPAAVLDKENPQTVPAAAASEVEELFAALDAEAEEEKE